MDRLSELDGWQRTPLGDGVRFDAPDGATSVWIWPRSATLAPPRRLARERFAATFGAAAAVEVAAVEAVPTDEGEIALLARATTPGDPARGCSASICGELPCLRVEVAGADHHRLAHLLARSLGLGLGRDRRRLYFYVPPQGWHGMRRGSSTVWLHPQYPRVEATITILDARPFAVSAAERLDRWLYAQRLPVAARFDVREEVATVRGLRGRLRTIHVPHGLHVAAALADERFLYLAHFAGPEAEVAVFRAVLESATPALSEGKIEAVFTYLE